MSQNMRESERFFTRSSISVKRARVATWRGRVSETVPFVSLEKNNTRAVTITRSRTEQQKTGKRCEQYTQ